MVIGEIVSKTPAKNGTKRTIIEEPPTAETITPEIAQQILNDKLQVDAQAFLDNYMTLCQKYETHLIATPGLSDGRIVAYISHLSIRGQIVEIRQQ